MQLYAIVRKLTGNKVDLIFWNEIQKQWIKDIELASKYEESETEFIKLRENQTWLKL